MSDTPRTDAAEVDLMECVSVETVGGKRRYARKYVPASVCREIENELAALKAAQQDMVSVPFINSPNWPFGQGTELEEKMIRAGTKFITQTIGFYSTGDRRFTVGLFNSMLAASQRKEGV